MKQIIWVVGTSSAGKKTFLENISTDLSLQNTLGLQSKKTAIVQRSIDYPGSTTSPDVVRERELIPSDAAKLLTENDVVLIKWQYMDSLYTIPHKLKGSPINCKHSVIWLAANEAESVKRLGENEWWKRKGFKNALDIYNYEQSIIDQYITELSNHFPITKLDSSSQANYALL